MTRCAEPACHSMGSRRNEIWRARAAFLVCFGAVALILGAKFGWIQSHGSDVPYMDQWDAEGWRLFMPYTEAGRVPFERWIEPHNEHRIVFTRLLSVALLAANRQWDAQLQMTVNALLHVVFAVGVFWLARRLSPAAWVLPVAVVTALLCTIATWENTLTGFQSQFYFVAVFGTAAVALLTNATAGTPRWWVGILVGSACLGTMSTGVLAPLAVACVIGARAIYQRRVERTELLTGVVLIAVVALGVTTTPRLPHHAPLAAQSPLQFAGALLACLGWPSSQGWLAPALQAPLVVLLVRRWSRRDMDNGDWLILALGIWATLQTAAVAYGRGAGPVASTPRYADVFAIGIVVQSLALARLWRPGLPVVVLAASWVMVLAVSLGQRETAARAALSDWPARKAAEKGHLNAYLETGDREALNRAPPAELPHIFAQTLISNLDHPGVRGVLPASIRPPLRLQPAAASQGFKVEDAAGPRSAQGAVWRAAHGPATFISEPLPRTRLPIWRFHFAATEDVPPESIGLIGSDGSERTLQGVRIAGARWQTAHLTVPSSDTFQLRITLKRPEDGIAFARPVEIGRLTWLAHQLRKQSSVLIGSGVVAATAGLLGLCLVRTQPLRAPRQSPGVPASNP